MKIGELLALLNDLPVEALEMPIYVDNGGMPFRSVSLEKVTESCDDSTVIGYVLVDPDDDDEPKQIELDFTKDTNNV